MSPRRFVVRCLCDREVVFNADIDSGVTGGCLCGLTVTLGSLEAPCSSEVGGAAATDPAAPLDERGGAQ